MEAYEKAKTYLEEIPKKDRFAEYYLNQAVIMSYLEDYEAGLSCLEQAKKMGADQEQIDKTYGEICLSAGNLQEALLRYETLYSQNPRIGYLRRMAGIAYELSAGNEDYLEKAIQYYELFTENSPASYSDRQKLVNLYLMCSKTGYAINLLEEMTVMFPQEYEVFLQLGILRYNEEIKKPISSQNYEKIGKLIDTAEKLYRQQHKELQDVQLEAMLELMEQMK